MPAELPKVIFGSAVIDPKDQLFYCSLIQRIYEILLPWEVLLIPNPKVSAFQKIVRAHLTVLVFLLLRFNVASYNTLLYGLAIGCNRISQLSEFSGYPKNKCDKYLKALDAAGYIETEQKKDENGQVRTHYFLKGGYLRVWYQLYFPRQQDFLDPLDEDAIKELVFWIDECATKYYFRKLCWHWFSRNASGFYGDGSVASGNPAQHDIIVNGVPLDFIQHGKDRDLYMKIWDDPEVGFPKDLFQKVEKATTTTRPFYDNIYFLFSIGRVCNYVEDLRKLGTVSIVELRSFFGRNSAEHFEKL